jgi:hypothetical protein
MRAKLERGLGRVETQAEKGLAVDAEYYSLGLRAFNYDYPAFD